ncbi:MAG: hypothetical protein WCG34_07370, partial [Leptolinea sp.]
QQTVSASLDVVLISGDLFDKDFNNYTDFEKLAKEFPKLNIWILPGNHVSGVSSRSLVGKNLRIFEKTEIIKDDISFLMVPYQPGTTMGEVIASQMEFLSPKQWALFGHGDWPSLRAKQSEIMANCYLKYCPIASPLQMFLIPKNIYFHYLQGKSDCRGQARGLIYVKNCPVASPQSGNWTNPCYSGE